ncbi:unnamed protein product, partial [marine sediment metagenome]
ELTDKREDYLLYILSCVLNADRNGAPLSPLDFPDQKVGKEVLAAMVDSHLIRCVEKDSQDDKKT